MQIGLTVRVTALSVALVAITGIVVGTLVYQGSSRLLVDRALDDLAVGGRLLLGDLSADLQRLRLASQFFARTPPVAGLLRARQAADPTPGTQAEALQWRDQLAEIFAQRMAYAPHYLQMRLLGADPPGQELVRVERGPDGVRVVTAPELQDKGRRGYVRAGLSLSPGDSYVSRIDLNREQGRIQVPHTPTLRVATAAAAPGQGTTAGLLVINLDLRPFMARLAELEAQPGDGRHVYLVDSQGNFLYHRDPQRRFGFDQGRRQRVQESIPDLAAFLSGAQLETTLQVKGRDGPTALHAVKAYLDPRNEAQFIALIQTTPYSTVVAGAEDLRNRSLWLTTALVLAGALLAVFSARYVTRPLRNMTHAVQGVAAGDLQPRGLPVCGGELGILAGALREMARAVTSRENALAAERARLAAIFRTAVDAVVLIDEHGIVLECNPACESLFDYPRETLVGNNVSQLMPEPYRSRHNDYLQRYREGAPARSIGIGREVSGQRRDGSTFPMYLSVGEIRQGEERLFVGIIHDISAYHAALEEIQRQAKELERSNRDLADFAFVASHDLQEPLRKVISFGQILETDYADRLDAEGREFLGYMISGAQRMRDLLQGLLAYSRVNTHAQPHQAVDLRQILTQVTADLSMQIEDSGAQLNLHDLPTLHGDPTQIRQLFQNLLSNALKFRDSARPLQIEVWAEHSAQTDSTAGRPAWKISVSDNGIGIPEESMEAVFQPFKRLHHRDQYPGTGLGLAMCAKIAARHNGHISVRANPEAGCRFELYLPRAGE